MVVALLAWGCVATNPHSPFMRPAPSDPDPELAPPNRARVVFVRTTSGVGGAYLVIDENGRFLGESAAGTRFSVWVAAGAHYFIAWGSGTTEALHATLAPGRTYWVLVSGKPGLWAITPDNGLMKEIPSYLAESKEVVPDTEAGQAHLDRLGGRVAKAVKEGIATYQAYSDKDRADATLLPGDDIPR